MAALPDSSNPLNWGTSYNEFLQVSHNADGTIKSSAVTSYAFGESTNLDSDGNPMAKAHAYLAMQDGFVVAWSSSAAATQLSGYVGTTTDPAGAGTLVSYTYNATTGQGNIFFPVKSGKYFEITVNSTQSVTIRWFPIGTLSAPVNNN